MNSTRSLSRASLFALVFSFLCSLFACSPEGEASSGSNSNWLVACDSTSECGAGSCVCGLCTLECANSDDCSEINGATCAESASSVARSQCPAEVAPSSICLATCEPGDCSAGNFCFDSQCVTLALPESDACAPVLDVSESLRQREEELVNLLQGFRETVAMCGGGTPVGLPELRLDGRLICAARTLATDLEASGALDLVDSEGRDSEERFDLSGYPPLTWGESFARAPSIADVFEIMASGETSCAPLVDASLTDLGVGCSGETCVISLGSEP